MNKFRLSKVQRLEGQMNPTLAYDSYSTHDSSNVAFLDVFGSFTGHEPFITGTYVGKIGNAYLSGTQKFQNVPAKDLEWEVLSNLAIRGRNGSSYTQIRNPKVRKDHPLYDALYSHIVLPSEDAAKEIFAISSTPLDFDKTKYEFPSQSLYVAMARPELNKTIFASESEARLHARITSLLDDDTVLLDEEEKKTLLESLPTPAISAEQYDAIKSSLKLHNDCILATAFIKRAPVSSVLTVALMSSRIDADDTRVTAIAERFEEMLFLKPDDVGPNLMAETISRSIQSTKRTSPETIVALTKAAAQFRKGKNSLADTKKVIESLCAMEDALHDIIEPEETYIQFAHSTDHIIEYANQLCI